MAVEAKAPMGVAVTVAIGVEMTLVNETILGVGLWARAAGVEFPGPTGELQAVQMKSAVNSRVMKIDVLVRMDGVPPKTIFIWRS